MAQEQEHGAAPAVHATDDAHGESAASHDEHGESDKPALLQFDPGSAIWSIIIFLVLLLVLRVFAWNPILNGLKQREQFIHDSLAQAKRDRDEAEARLKQYEAKLDQARADATAIVDEGRRDAEALKRSIEADARKEGEAIIERAKREIGIARDTAVKDLYGLSAQLATDIASKIIRKELTPADHERLIAESIEQLSALRPNGKA